jgi:hypothetical protein
MRLPARLAGTANHCLEILVSLSCLIQTRFCVVSYPSCRFAGNREPERAWVVVKAFIQQPCLLGRPGSGENASLR